MSNPSRLPQVLITSVVSLASSLLSLVLLGVVLPMWIMKVVYGQAQVDDATNHGGILLFVTIPLAAILISAAIVPFWGLIYRKLS